MGQVRPRPGVRPLRPPEQPHDRRHARAIPSGDLPDGVPVLLDLPRDSTPDDETLRAHWLRAAGVRAPVILAGSLDPGQRGRGGAHRAAMGGRHRPRRGELARHQGPGPHAPLHPQRKGRHMSTMPDARGRFGDFGGRFVPETVMGALDELLAAWETAWSDPAFHAAPRPAGARLRGAAVPALPRGAAGGVRARRPHLPEARGPEPHRRAQDQQRGRAGAAGRAAGQAPDRGRDRRRAARRRQRHGVRAVRAGLPRLHGRGGHPPAAPQRGADADAGRRGDPGDGRLRHAQGRDERGHPRLDHERRGHALPDRLGGRAAPLPGAGA